MLGAVRATIAFAILGFVPGLLDPFIAPKAAVLRVVGLGLLAVVTAEALSRFLPLSAPAWSERPVDRRHAPHGATGHAMDLAVAAWVAVSLLATLTSVSPRLSLLGEIEQRAGLLTTLGLAGLYAGARRSHRGPVDVRRTLDVLLACASITAAYALIQFAGLDPLVWAGTSVYPAGAGNVLRPFGTLGNPVLLGALLAPALGIAVARVAGERGDAWRVAPVVVLLATACVATLSRGTWLAAGAAVTVALAGSLALDGARARRRAGLALALASVPAVVWGLVGLRGPLIARMSEGLRAEAVSVPARLEIARSALALWSAHPWLGSGPDTFGLMFPAVQTAAFWRGTWLGIPVQADSVMLQVLATGGLLTVFAGLAWVGAIALATAGTWRVRSERRGDSLDVLTGLAGLVVAGLVNPVGIAGAVVFAVLAALAVMGNRDGGALGRSPGRGSSGVWLAGLVVAAVLAFVSMRELAALAAAGGARDALERVPLASDASRSRLAVEAVRRSTEAVGRAPGEDELWRLCCDAHLARAREALAHGDSIVVESAAADAEAAAWRAVRLEPRRAANLQRLGNALALRARVVGSRGPSPDRATPAERDAPALAERADSVFAAACRLAPFDGLILVDRARARLELHRPERALAVAQRIEALYPEAATGYALEAAARLMLGQRDETRMALRRALAARWEEGAESEHRVAEGFLRGLEAASPAR